MLTWEIQNIEKDAPSKTGESIGRQNIVIAKMPFGMFWIGQTVVLNAQNDPIFVSKFTILYNNALMAIDIETLEEAKDIAAKWYAEKVKEVLSLTAADTSTPVEASAIDTDE